jgi:flagellar basal body-associated protein FliL
MMMMLMVMIIMLMLLMMMSITMMMMVMFMMIMVTNTIGYRVLPDPVLVHVVVAVAPNVGPLVDDEGSEA